MHRPALLLLAAVCLHAADIDSLKWLAGCWEMKSPRSHTEEQWMRPAGGAMLGMSRTVAGGRMRFYETMRIETREGKLVFIAKPASNKEETAFTEIRASDDEVAFENAAHDFPQRVIYTRNSDGSIKGRIEGVQNGKPRAENFPMQRVACPQ